MHPELFVIYSQMVPSNGLKVDLSLNIIAQPVAITRPAVTPHANKKTNKYERRRQRSSKTNKKLTIKHATTTTTTTAVGRATNSNAIHGRGNNKHAQDAHSNETKRSEDSIPQAETVQNELPFNQSNLPTPTTIPTNEASTIVQGKQMGKVNTHTPEIGLSDGKLDKQTPLQTDDSIQGTTDAARDCNIPSVASTVSRAAPMVEFKLNIGKEVQATNHSLQHSNKKPTENTFFRKPISPNVPLLRNFSGYYRVRTHSR